MLSLFDKASEDSGLTASLQRLQKDTRRTYLMHITAFVQTNKREALGQSGASLVRYSAPEGDADFIGPSLTAEFWSVKSLHCQKMLENISSRREKYWKIVLKHIRSSNKIKPESQSQKDGGAENIKQHQCFM